MHAYFSDGHCLPETKCPGNTFSLLHSDHSNFSNVLTRKWGMEAKSRRLSLLSCSFTYRLIVYVDFFRNSRFIWYEQTADSYLFSYATTKIVHIHFVTWVFVAGNWGGGALRPSRGWSNLDGHPPSPPIRGTTRRTSITSIFCLFGKHARLSIGRTVPPTGNCTLSKPPSNLATAG